MHPKLKYLLAFLVTMAAWFTAAPAWASDMVSRTAPAVPSRAAPLCDMRGATMFAPTPTLDGPSASIDVGQDDASCLPSFEGHSYEEGHHPSPSSSGEAAPEGVIPGTAHTARMLLAGFVAWPVLEETAPAGVRDSIERPPR
ncbi:hypothetical protein LVJ94_52980 [Pendulispora rubella]|uniref:Secreted protein n=1 Tax=Pendulispora rubella TaxID=2741070 RepID=A0ABZ2L3V8_9BACT